MRRVYQNAQEIIKDWMRKIKYTRLKKLYSAFSTDSSIKKENSIQRGKFKIECLIEFFKVYLNLLRV
jgi:hypothetical protein